MRKLALTVLILFGLTGAARAGNLIMPQDIKSLGTRSYSSTAAASSYEQGWEPVAVTTFNAVSQVYITGLSSTDTWKFEWNYAQNISNGIWQYRFNSDSGGNYQWTSHRITSDSNHSVEVGSSDTENQFTGTGTTRATDSSTGELIVNDFPTSNGVKTITGYGSGYFQNSSNAAGEITHGFRWNNGQQLSTITFFPSAGTVTGYIVIWRKRMPQIWR